MTEEALGRAAQSYEDEFTSAEDLVEAARRRLAWRLRRAQARPCSECGAPLLGRRADALTCSGACRERRRHRRAMI